MKFCFPPFDLSCSNYVVYQFWESTEQFEFSFFPTKNVRKPRCPQTLDYRTSAGEKAHTYNITKSIPEHPLGIPFQGIPFQGFRSIGKILFQIRKQRGYRNCKSALANLQKELYDLGLSHQESSLVFDCLAFSVHFNICLEELFVSQTSLGLIVVMSHLEVSLP